MNVISAPATIRLKRGRRYGLIVVLAALAAAVACVLAVGVDWSSTESQANESTRAAPYESAGGWSGIVDPATGIPLSAGVVGVPTAMSESAGGWTGLVDPATGIPLSAGIVGVPTAVSESAGGWTGLVDPATGIPLSAGVVGVPTAVSESAGGWTGLVDTATGVPLSAGVIGLPTSEVPPRPNRSAR